MQKKILPVNTPHVEVTVTENPASAANVTR
jgi:hypothetical protein